MACGRVEPQSKALADARTNFCRCSVLQMQLVHNPGELGFKSFGNFPFERLDASKRRRKNMFTMIHYSGLELLRRERFVSRTTRSPMKM